MVILFFCQDWSLGFHVIEWIDEFHNVSIMFHLIHRWCSRLLAPDEQPLVCFLGNKSWYLKNWYQVWPATVTRWFGTHGQWKECNKPVPRAPSPKTWGREVNWSLRGEFQIPIPWIRGVFKTCFALTSRNFSCDTMDFWLLYSIPCLFILHRCRMMSAFIPDVLLLAHFRFLFFHELAQEQRIYFQTKTNIIW